MTARHLPAPQAHHQRQQYQHHQRGCKAGAKAFHGAGYTCFSLPAHPLNAQRSQEPNHAQSSHRPDADHDRREPVQWHHFFLVKDEGHSNRLVTALTVRVVLAVITVALIAWGFFSSQLVSQAPW